jgi:hypothetical protein
MENVMSSAESRPKPDHKTQFSHAAGVVQPSGSESKEVPNTRTASQAESLLAAEKRHESPSGTIIREWHPQGKIPGRLARRKTLTLFLLWRGPPVPTALLNSSIGAGWITPASLLKTQIQHISRPGKTGIVLLKGPA